MLGAEDGGSVGRLLFFVASVDLDDECCAPVAKCELNLCYV